MASEVKKIIAYLILALVFFILYGSVAIESEVEIEITKEILVASLIFNFIILFFSALTVAFLLYGNVFQALYFRKEKILQSILFSILLTISFIIISSLIISLLGYKEESPLGKEIAENVDYFLLFLIPLLSSVSEETFFRGLIFMHLKNKIGVLPSMFITSILFAFAHLSYGTLLQIILPFAYSFVLCFLIYKFENIYAPIASHFFNNFLVLCCVAQFYNIEILGTIV